MQINQCSCNVHHKIYPTESRRLFRALEEEVEYLSPETTRIKLFGKLHDIPRRNVGYGDKGVVYKYSGLSLEAKEWTQTLREIKSDVESASGHSYNFVLVNRYADGGDCMGEHRDDEAEQSEQRGVEAQPLLEQLLDGLHLLRG